MDSLTMILKVLKYTVTYGIPIIFSLHTWLYNKNSKYYFIIVRLFSKWRDTTWAINANYQVNDIGDFYQQIEEILKRKYKTERYKKEVNMINKKLYRCNGFNLLIQDDFNAGDFSSKSIYFSISELNVTYKTAEEKLRHFRELFNEIERATKPNSLSFNLDVYFKNGKNPFYGLMVQRLGKSNVSHFECFFPVSAIIQKSSDSAKDSHYLRVFKEKFTINESSFDILEETAKRALLFK